MFAGKKNDDNLLEEDRSASWRNVSALERARFSETAEIIAGVYTRAVIFLLSRLHSSTIGYLLLVGEAAELSK